MLILIYKGVFLVERSYLKQLLTEYDKKRMQAIYEADKRKETLYKEFPRLAEIDSLLSKEAIQTSRALITNPDHSLLKQLNQKINTLKKEKISILHSIGKEESYLKPIFECPICEDTGYVTNQYTTEMCSCLKQHLLDLEYHRCNIFNLKKKNFEHIKSTFYSSNVDEIKYHSKLSPRKNIENIKKISIQFIENFDNPDEKNLLFTGNTGLGKSFLSSCIANELLKKGKTVLYQTAPVMLDSIIDYRFSKGNVSKDVYQQLLDVDLLIIDDLGTEAMNNIKFSELFNIINSRLLNAHHITKTLISTNLSLQNLFASYDERIVSRIIGNYNICYFFGEDIRFLKRQLS